MALIRRPTCTTCWRESPLTRSIVSTSCCPGIGVRAADDAHAPKRGALRRKPSLDQTSELINLPINEQTSRARDPNSRRGSPDAYEKTAFFTSLGIVVFWLKQMKAPAGTRVGLHQFAVFSELEYSPPMRHK